MIAAGASTPISRGRERALQMINRHMEAQDDIYIPAPAFAECCHEIDGGVLAKLRVIPFNATAAVVTNRIVADFAKKHRKGDKTPTWQQTKIDAMILGTAEAFRADILYVGGDSWFDKARAAARLKVEVRELPPIEPEQMKLEQKESAGD